MYSAPHELRSQCGPYVRRSWSYAAFTPCQSRMLTMCRRGACASVAARRASTVRCRNVASGPPASRLSSALPTSSRGTPPTCCLTWRASSSCSMRILAVQHGTHGVRGQAHAAGRVAEEVVLQALRDQDEARPGLAARSNVSQRVLRVRHGRLSGPGVRIRVPPPLPPGTCHPNWWASRGERVGEATLDRAEPVYLRLIASRRRA